MNQNALIEMEPPRFERGKAMLIAGLKQSYPVDRVEGIPAQWQRFSSYIGKLDGRVGRKAYGVCYPCEGTGRFDYLCGVEVARLTALPPELSGMTIPERRYAVFSHRGSLSRMAETFAAIWNKWLPESGYQAAEAPSIELYPDDFDVRVNPAGVEIWLPIHS